MDDLLPFPCIVWNGAMWRTLPGPVPPPPLEPSVFAHRASVRARLLEVLDDTWRSTEAVGRQAGCSDKSLRTHLRLLVAEGLVEVREERRPLQRGGVPARWYRRRSAA